MAEVLLTCRAWVSVGPLSSDVAPSIMPCISHVSATQGLEFLGRTKGDPQKGTLLNHRGSLKNRGSIFPKPRAPLSYPLCKRLATAAISAREECKPGLHSTLNPKP